MLEDEGFQRLGRRRTLAVLREEAAVAEMPTAADHRQVDRDHAAGLGDRDHIRVRIAAGGVDELLLAHGGEHAQAVAQEGGRLEIERSRSGVHLLGNVFSQCAGLAVQQLGCFMDVAHRPRA